MVQNISSRMGAAKLNDNRPQTTAFKYVYPSSATNWANDIFAVRHLFRKEHEHPEEDSNNLPDNMVDTLVMLQDSLFQYELMPWPKIT